MTNNGSGPMPYASPTDGGWMGDVQRILAITLIGVLALSVLAFSIRLTISASVEVMLDVVKTQLAAMVNMALIALGFFFGSTIQKQRNDVVQANLMDKLTPQISPQQQNPVPVPPWWGRLTEAEKNAISAEAANDPRVAAFITASQVGAATKDDLGYIVSKNLLTAARADEIARG